MLALLPAFLLATAALAAPGPDPSRSRMRRGGGLVGAFPSGLVPANVTSAGPVVLATAAGAVAQVLAAPTAVIPAVSTTVFGSNVIPGTIQITKNGDSTPYYLSFNQASYNNGLYTLTTDRSAADNFTIPSNSCGSSATRFGISSTVNPGTTPFFSPAAYAFYAQYYNFEEGQATRCAHTAPGAQAISTSNYDNGYVCESDIWHVDCKTNVLDALFTSGTSSLPISWAFFGGNPFVQSFSTDFYNQIAASYNQYYGVGNPYFGGLTLTFIPDPTKDVVAKASGFISSFLAKATPTA